MADDPVEPTDDLRPASGVIGIEHFDGPESRARSNADDAVEVVERADCSGDVGPVTVVVSPAPGPSAIDTADDVEVWMVGIDPGIENGHVGIDQAESEQIAKSEDATAEILLGIDPIDAGGEAFRRRGDWEVGGDLDHIRVDFEALRRNFRKLTREAVKRVEIDVGRSDPHLGGGFPGIGIVIEHDDDRLTRRGRDDSVGIDG